MAGIGTERANTFEGILVKNVVSPSGLHQKVKEPKAYSWKFILMYRLRHLQPNVIVDSGVYPWLNPNCHHQIICLNFNLKIHYPPPYNGGIWHYKYSNDDLIRREMNQLNWERASENRNLDGKVLTFSKTVLGIEKIKT